MNAAERLWRGLEQHDWAAVRSQFQPHAAVEWPHRGARMDVEAYVTAQIQRLAGGAAVGVRRVVTEGRNVVVEARVGTEQCAGFYDLHDGLVAGAVEYWVGDPA
jgi:hypothetical protein